MMSERESPVLWWNVNASTYFDSLVDGFENSGCCKTAFVQLIHTKAVFALAPSLQIASNLVCLELESGIWVPMMWAKVNRPRLFFRLHNYHQRFLSVRSFSHYKKGMPDLLSVVNADSPEDLMELLVTFLKLDDIRWSDALLLRNLPKQKVL